MTTLTRPVPMGTNDKGMPLWNGDELRFYREALGIPQADVARSLGVSQAAISLYESRRPHARKEDRMREYLDAIERLASRRSAMAAEGRAKLDALRGVPTVTRTKR